MGISVDASQLVALRARLKHSAERVEVAAAGAVAKSAHEILTTAQGNAPVRTGELRASGKVIQAGATAAAVTFTSDHAGFVEHGTSMMAPEPYLAPAFDAVEPRFERQLGEVAARALL